MVTTNQPVAAPMVELSRTVMGRVYHYISGHESSEATRLALIVALAVLVHLAVKAIRHLSEWLIYKGRARKGPLDFMTQEPKFVTLIQFAANSMTFVMYFFALGLVLQEFGVKLANYLASASIVALAISFGSQGLVQDVVIGLTLIFSDAMDAGDLVEITGSATVVGRVEEIGLRFTAIRNFYNQVVFIPNRTIANVSRYPHGGIYVYADVQLPPGADRERVMQAIRAVAKGTWTQFGAIILSEPEVGPVETVGAGGWDFARVRFKIWPGQGGLIETTFRQQMVGALRAFKPDYADWQVPVTYRALPGS
jgi:moderate conductance mechanosensitive channel